MKLYKLVLIFLIFSAIDSFSQTGSVKIGLLKYGGGGDWYANLETSLPNLINFCNKNLHTNIDEKQGIVDVGSPDIYNYPIVHMTGHGNVIFSQHDVENLRNYLISGGFLHIDDNYGLNKYVRREMKKIFPNIDFVELPFSFPIYHQKYDFPKGLPKIHKHDGKPPQGFGIIYKGRLVCFYTYECDLGDGWEDQIIHNDSQEKRLKALKMGADIISYVFDN